MDTKTAVIPMILLFISSLLIGCAEEEPGIEGSSGQWLSNDTIAVRAVAVYRRDVFPQTREAFWQMFVSIRNDGVKDFDLRWVRAEFRGKGISPNMVWSPLFTDSIPENITVKGVVRESRITETDIVAMESELGFPLRRLQPRDTCTTLLTPFNPKEPSQVKIKVRFGDGTQSRPFLITVSKPNQDP